VTVQMSSTFVQMARRYLQQGTCQTYNEAIMNLDRVVEGFAVETGEHWIFTVKGLLHPPERVIAYLRYLPDAGGNRKRGEIAYRRVYRFEEQIDILRSLHPEYLGHDAVLGLEVQSVPRSAIYCIHDPCAYLASLRRRGPDSAAEEDALAMAEEVQRASGVPWTDLGISGSLMLGTQRNDSDLDLLIYGTDSCRVVHRSLVDLLDGAAVSIHSLELEELQGLHAAHRPDTPLSFHDFARLQRRKVNEGRYRDRAFFLRFVRRPEELGEQYGDRRYKFVGRARITATVHDDSDAVFTPCCYRVGKATILAGPQVDDLREIVSFRGRFSDQLRAGEIAEGCGRLERVVPKAGKSYHRLVVGGEAGDWLLARERA
jgi:predicted nucleotidyltransferase